LALPDKEIKQSRKHTNCNYVEKYIADILHRQ